MNLDEETILKALNSVQYSVNDFVSQAGLIEVLDKLNGQTFDKEVLEQLWSQCKENSLGQIQLRDFVDTLLRAKKILIEKNNQVLEQLTKFNQQIKSLEIEHAVAQNFYTRSDIEKKIAELQELIAIEKESKTDYNINLQILNKPFSGYRRLSRRRNNSELETYSKDQNEQLAKSPSKQLIQPKYNDLRCVLYTTVPLILVECTLMFQKMDFLNLLFYCSVLLIFIITNVDKTYIRTTLGILLMSILTDILWMTMYAGRLWSPPSSSEYPQMTQTFRRICLIATLLLIFGKLFIGALLLKYRNLQQPVNVRLQLMDGTRQQSINQPVRDFLTYNQRKAPTDKISLLS